MTNQESPKEPEVIKVELPFWTKGMKVTCPRCENLVSDPYICSCGVKLKLVVKLALRGPNC